MQVNVFVMNTSSAPQEYQLLVLPYGPEAVIPDKLKHIPWRHLAVTHLSDRLLTSVGPIIEAQLGKDGYALLPLTR